MLTWKCSKEGGRPPFLEENVQIWRGPQTPVAIYLKFEIECGAITINNLSWRDLALNYQAEYALAPFLSFFRDFGIQHVGGISEAR